MQKREPAMMQEMQGQQVSTDDRPQRAAPSRTSIVAPLIFLLCVGIAAIALLYLGVRDLVLPMLFLSLPLATLWLIVNDRQRRD